MSEEKRSKSLKSIFPNYCAKEAIKGSLCKNTCVISGSTEDRVDGEKGLNLCL